MINKIEKIFRKIIITLRRIQRKHCLVNQYCKKCGTEMDYDYSINDFEWNQYIPNKYNNHVLCLNCFIQEYAGDINELEITYYKI